MYTDKDKVIEIANLTAEKHHTKYNVVVLNNCYEMVLDSYINSNPDKVTVVYTTKDFSYEQN